MIKETGDSIQNVQSDLIVYAGEIGGIIADFAAVVAIIIAICSLYLTRNQLSAARKLAKAQILSFLLEKRKDYELIKSDSLLRNIRAHCRKSAGQNQTWAAVFEKIILQSKDPELYASVANIVNFTEMIGYVIEVQLIEESDAKELFGQDFYEYAHYYWQFIERIDARSPNPRKYTGKYARRWNPEGFVGNVE